MGGEYPSRPTYGVYISKLIRFARICSNVDDFNADNKRLTATLQKQGFQYHKLREAFSKFYHRHHELVSKFNVRLKSLSYQELLEPELYGNFVYKFRNIMGRTDFSDQFQKIIICLKRIGHNLKCNATVCMLSS